MIITKDEFSESLIKDFSAAVESTYQDLIRQAVLAEREECAKLCESHVRYPSRLYFADAIRARTTK